jgi:hypothetical protein
MKSRTKLSSRALLGVVGVLGLGAAACSVSSDAERGDFASASALRKDPGGDPGDPPPRAPPPPPPKPPPPADPLFITSESTVASVLRDEANFWQTQFASTDAAAELRAAFAANDPPYWGYQQRIDALVQMYDLLLPIDRGAAAKYLERLRVIARTLLENRDDVRRAPADAFRLRVMRAWGAYTHDRDEKWNTDVVTSGNFIYAMAAYARRVADQPSQFCDDALHDAIRFTSAAIETYAEFHDELRLDSSPWAWYAAPPTYAGLSCDDSTYEEMCEGYRDGAGQPVANNENLAMMRALAETALAADSALYRASKDGSGQDALSAFRLFYATNEAPLVIAKNVQWFRDHLTRNVWSNSAVYWGWEHQPGGHPEDTAHGQMDLGSLAVIGHDKPRLDALLAAHGHAERVPIDTALLDGFAKTFLFKVWQNPSSDPAYQNYLAGGVEGADPRNAAGKWNVECAGWLPLAEVDPWVWVRCRDTTFKPVDVGRDSLRVDNYAALLRYRQPPSDLPPAPPLRPPVPVLCGPPVMTSRVTTSGK